MTDYEEILERCEWAVVRDAGEKARALFPRPTLERDDGLDHSTDLDERAGTARIRINARHLDFVRHCIRWFATRTAVTDDQGRAQNPPEKDFEIFRDGLSRVFEAACDPRAPLTSLPEARLSSHQEQLADTICESALAFVVLRQYGPAWTKVKPEFAQEEEFYVEVAGKLLKEAGIRTVDPEQQELLERHWGGECRGS